MQLFPRLRLVPDGTQIQFMKGRHVGLVFSALLSILSVILYFAPGLNYGIDFKGGIVIEARAPGPVEFSTLRPALSALNLGQVGLQQFGSPQDVLIRLERQRADVAERCRAKRPPANEQERQARQRAVTEEEAQQCAVEEVRASLEAYRSGTQVRRVEPPLQQRLETRRAGRRVPPLLGQPRAPGLGVQARDAGVGPTDVDHQNRALERRMSHGPRTVARASRGVNRSRMLRPPHS